jgi:hypothetical protein
MSKDLLPTPPGANAPPRTHLPPILLNKNVGPAPGQMQAQPQLTQGIKTMHLCLPHPCSLDVLPSLTDKWSTTTHPIKGKIVGFINSTISYQHFYFHQGRVLHTKAFAASTTAITVRNSGKSKGSTMLDDATGYNCAMAKKEYVTFAVIVLGLHPGLQHGTRQTGRSHLNMLLDNFATLTNNATVYLLNEPTDKHTLARILACFSLLMLGADALTPAIVERVWGQDDVVHQQLGSPRGDLAIIRRHLILLAFMANNAFHLWLNTSFKGKTIITPEALKHVPQGIPDILLLIKDNTSAIYVRKPLPSGKDHIQKLQHNLRQHRLFPKSSTFYNFEDTIVHWYRDLLLKGINSTNSAGEENHLFAAYGLTPLKYTA